MLNNMIGTLLRLINGRDVSSMKCREAQKIVSDFYMSLELRSIGKSLRETQKMDYLSKKALNAVGLGLFA